MDDVRIGAADVTLTVAPASGGRWAALRIDDLDVLGRGGPRLLDWGCYPMAPFAGRIRDGLLDWGGRRHPLPRLMPPHAIHGVCLDRAWQVEHLAPSEVVLSCPLDARWPWRGLARQHLSLTDDALVAVLEVHADEPMPAWIGYHPWFARRLARGAAARIEFDAGSWWPRDDAGMPTDPVAPPADRPPFWDDCFSDLRADPRVVWDGALALTLSTDNRYWVVYDEKPDAVCVEPQTAPPNAAELGLADVAVPGAPLRLTTRLSWQRLG